MIDHQSIHQAFLRHGKAAFQFSGGRDSTAALYLLREYWPKMWVYHLDTGDQFPETRKVVEHAFMDFGSDRFTIIQGDVRRIRNEVGLASDVVPVDNIAPGRLVSGRSIRIISRYECCYLSLMQPMHQALVESGHTLLIRGQRDEEYAQPPMRSGDSQDGIEVLYPIQHWTGAQVQDYLVKNSLPVAPFYERGMKRAPECMGCTAWWDEGRAQYLRDYHPDEYRALRLNMADIRTEVGLQLNTIEEMP